MKEAELDEVLADSPDPLVTADRDGTVARAAIRWPGRPSRWPSFLSARLITLRALRGVDVTHHQHTQLIRLWVSTHDNGWEPIQRGARIHGR